MRLAQPVLYLLALPAILMLVACESTGSVKSETTADVVESITGSPAKVFIDLAQAYSRNGQLDVALLYADKALSVDSGNPRAHAIYAYINSRLGDMDTANRSFDKALDIEPRDPFVQGYYGLYLCDTGKLAAADREFAKAAKSPVNRSPEVAWLSSGRCYEKAGNYEMARARMRRAYEIKRTPQIIEALARVEKKLGNRREANRLQRQL